METRASKRGRGAVNVALAVASSGAGAKHPAGHPATPPTLPDDGHLAEGGVLGCLMERLPDVFREVLGYLDHTDRAMLGRASRACREAVPSWDDWILVVERFTVRVELMAWAMENRCPWGSRITNAAAAGGHLEVLMWLHAHACVWDEHTCRGAAEGGHLEVLKWARERDCPWSAMTCAYAAQGGHFDVLRWLRERDCPWDERTCEVAATVGHLEVLRWARDNGCPCPALPNPCKAVNIVVSTSAISSPSTHRATNATTSPMCYLRSPRAAFNLCT